MGEAVSGDMQGSKLTKLPSTMTTWGNWKKLHPDTSVYIKRSIPYHPRFTAATFSGLASRESGPIQDRDWIVGVEGHVEARAYLVRYLARERVRNDTLEKGSIVVYISKDLATVRILDRTVDGKVLKFSLAAAEHLRDSKTGSLWDPLTGEAISGPMKGKRMKSLVSTYSLWFAWKKYRPDTVLVAEK